LCYYTHHRHIVYDNAPVGKTINVNTYNDESSGKNIDVQGTACATISFGIHHSQVVGNKHNAEFISTRYCDTHAQNDLIRSAF